MQTVNDTLIATWQVANPDEANSVKFLVNFCEVYCGLLRSTMFWPSFTVNDCVCDSVSDAITNIVTLNVTVHFRLFAVKCDV